MRRKERLRCGSASIRAEARRPITRKRKDPLSRGEIGFTVRAKNKRGELYLYGDIDPDFGIAAKDILAEIKKLGTIDGLDTYINSPGGSVFEGVAIHNIIDRQPNTVVHIDGLAASAASIVAMAGDEIRIAENGMIMIHDPWTFAMGNAAELRDLADTLDQIGGTLRDTYVRRTGQEADEVARMMAEETWMTAEEVVALGFADRTTAAVEVEACFDLSRYAQVPEAAAAFLAEAPAPRRPHPSLVTMRQRLRKRGL